MDRRNEKPGKTFKDNQPGEKVFLICNLPAGIGIDAREDPGIFESGCLI